MNKALLLILDGYGINSKKYGNAIAAANTPNLDKFHTQNPVGKLTASGLDVGLLDGDMGNSEVGHLNIGAGRVVYQMNSLIMKKIDDKSFFENKEIIDAIDHVKIHKSNLHIMGLLSNGNVHSNINHIWALLKFAKVNGLEQVYFHAFMDGRDTLPNSGFGFIKEFQQKSKEIGIGKIATISGRYYAMDRDTRWDRVEKAYKAFVQSEGENFTDPIKAIESSYNDNISDEFIIPKVIVTNGKAVAKINDNDSVVAFNFRADRMRQITRALKITEFDEFPTEDLNNLKFVCFNEYDVKFNEFVSVAFKLPKLNNILGEIISKNGLKQLRLAETEKYAHVTFFFNGGVEEPFMNEDRILVKSPNVATYDLKPEMSAFEVKDKLISAINSNEYSLIITNFANCDMVGHTGFFDAAIKAVETVDKCIGEIIPIGKKNNYNILLTADHGNADKMLDSNGNVFTAHSLNKVPLVISLTGNNLAVDGGKLADIAPTVLKIMGIPKPPEMTGKCLI
ncbi:MAG: 2,3-bisphosphoglycerate-independent phosphoglycerate mutase [Candidatus Cloacimonetes bacterium]|jgi:2,3-bisphosphoglycerate-independent phosphoglycerate mutase|nr:2,3-bisphosphoglycerate-independent phosphoglycerate mutase [Candidatus Cloacimonadota bacterium]